MSEPVWVLPGVVLAVHQMLIAEHGGISGTRDEALLDSALNRPQQRLAYSTDSTIFELAASYGYGLAGNHPFIDGNKRVALSVIAIFLELNGYSLDAQEAETVVIIEQLAAGQLTEDDLSIWLRKSTVIKAKQ
ncbi:MAG: death-on-curing protein [Gammaproteobacteria bacterium (ex Lamellibrachia satsuma)]|nr:MAG: type II toxin-antitoxin system death-on-curing family toxin [Gammaproteobacteria bacterium (ex Lamellibrachia satsuma)]RRS33623.1 MAG: death-on-curing protein [Gammaproteobacteria bacterium (ex Lamellibrachia satsuma)]RRS34810.1 MAG: death-on-curing protein [Gammaproteobacteria bacterium (ex Lamellibrachia satsuma)]